MRPHDAANYIETEEDAWLLIEAALEDGDADVVAEVLDAVKRSSFDYVAKDSML